MDLLLNIERYLRRTGIPPTRFGRDAANDPRLVLDLRRGRTIGAPLASRIDAYLAARRPGAGQGDRA